MNVFEKKSLLFYLLSKNDYNVFKYYGFLWVAWKVKIHILRSAHKKLRNTVINRHDIQEPPLEHAITKGLLDISNLVATRSPPSIEQIQHKQFNF